MFAAFLMLPIAAGLAIMPLGDSITVGCHDDTSRYSAYRLFLQDKLNAAEIPYDLVGPNTEGCPKPAYDLQHAGFSGISVDELEVLTRGFIDQYDPAMVLLLVGTNELLSLKSPEVLKDTYARLLDDIGNRSIYIATIPKVGYDRAGLGWWTDEFVDYTNNVRYAMINDRIRDLARERPNVHVVEFANSFDPNLGTVADKVHPNRAGQQLLADLFWEAAFAHPAMPGDFNGDARLDSSDIDGLAKRVREGPYEFQFDLRLDGQLNERDLFYWTHALREVVDGDVDFDGTFSSRDVVLAFQQGEYEDSLAHNSGWLDGDWDGNGDFETHDLVVAFQDSEYDHLTFSPGHLIPEPPTSGWQLSLLFVIATRLRKGHHGSRHAFISPVSA